MKLQEIFSSGDLDIAMLWNETPGDVKDSHTGEKSKLPIHCPKKLKKKNKRKKTVRDYLQIK